MNSIIFRCLTVMMLSVALSWLGQAQRHEDLTTWRHEDITGSEMKRYIGMMNRQADNPTADNRINVTYYKLDLRITVNPNYLRGTVTMKARSLQNNLTSITLDLTNSLTVDSVRVGGVRCGSSQSPSTLNITLNRPYSAGEMMTVETFYRGVPGSSGFGSFTFSSYAGTPWIWTLSEPYGSRDWWPCKDHQLDKADSVDVLVTCDSTFEVGSNGILTSLTSNGDGTRTHFWRHRYPIATYLVSITITNFAQFSNWFRYSPTDSMEILNYVVPDFLPQALLSLPLTVRMLQIFTNVFGEYPFIREKYGHAQFGWGGAMEHQTMTTTATFAEDVLAHELAHQWWGNMITCQTWPDLWINEGFAEYGTALYREGKDGTPGYWNIMYDRMATAKGAVGPIFLQDTSNAYAMFNWANVYCKGASVLHMLRRVLGDTVFFRALRTFADHPDFKHATASTSDFRAVCESVSGQNLAYFFNQWIYGENYPRYNYSWSSQPFGNLFQVQVQISQTTGTSNPPFFTMPIDLKLSGTGWDTTITIFNNQQTQLFSFIIARNPSTVQLDPQQWILRDTNLVSSVDQENGLPGHYVLEQNNPNPFNPSTEILFEIGQDGWTSLKVYDLLGREIAELVNEFRRAGRHKVHWFANDAPSGIYFYRLQTPNFISSKKMVFLK